MPYKDKTKQREASKIAQKRYYQNNKEYYRKKAIDHKKARQEWWNEFKQQFSCSRCSENHPVCLDFHHLDPTEKEYTVAHMARNGLGIKKILKEIEKCIVLCANCHRKEHLAE